MDATITRDAVFPPQKLPASKKNKEWKDRCVDALIGRWGSSRGMQNIDRKKINYDLYNSIFSEDDLRYVVNPFNVDSGFPARPQNFNIIRPKVNLLLGEETKRPWNFKVLRTSDEAKSKVVERKKEMLFQWVVQRLQELNGEQPDQKTSPKEIEDYISKDYIDVAEHVAYNGLKYLEHKLKIKFEFDRGWKDALIAGEEVYFVGQRNGDPFLERVNPLYLYYDSDPDLMNIEDGDWVVRKMHMTPSSIYDKFYDIIESKDLDDILHASIGNTINSKIGYERVVWKDRIKSDAYGKASLDDFNAMNNTGYGYITV